MDVTTYTGPLRPEVVIQRLHAAKVAAIAKSLSEREPDVVAKPQPKKAGRYIDLTRKR